MQFNSLNDAFSNNFIKSIAVLTRLNLTANEIKLVELVLSYTRNGQEFYMNHADIAEYLVLGQTKTKAKSVGNIIASLKKKGYVSTVTTPNYNGRNGGSSTTITVNEAFLEAQLHAAFNRVEVLDQTTPQVASTLALEPIGMYIETLTPSTSTGADSSPSNIETNEDFIAAMQADSDEPRPIPDLPWLAKSNSQIDEVNDQDDKEIEELGSVADGIKDINTFKFFLQELLNRRLMTNNKEKLQWIIDNQNSYDLEKMKGAFESLILRRAA